MDFEFVKGIPCVFVKKENLLVVGDLHIGRELKLEREGIHFKGATSQMLNSLQKAIKQTGAKRIVFLGDVKESITYPDFEEYKLLREFFKPLDGMDLYIAKGNHDSHMLEVLKQIGVTAAVENEIMIGDFAFMHGIIMPSEAVMQKSYLFTAHLHPRLEIADRMESVWMISKISAKAKKHYEKYNKKIQLVSAPAFSNIVIGKAISQDYERFFLPFRKGIFSFGSSKVYGLNGKVLGTALRLSHGK